MVRTRFWQNEVLRPSWPFAKRLSGRTQDANRIRFFDGVPVNHHVVAGFACRRCCERWIANRANERMLANRFPEQLRGCRLGSAPPGPMEVGHIEFQSAKCVRRSEVEYSPQSDLSMECDRRLLACAQANPLLCILQAGSRLVLRKIDAFD